MSRPNQNMQAVNGQPGPNRMQEQDGSQTFWPVESQQVPSCPCADDFESAWPTADQRLCRTQLTRIDRTRYETRAKPSAFSLWASLASEQPEH